MTFEPDRNIPYYAYNYYGNSDLEFPLVDRDEYKGRVKFHVYETRPPEFERYQDFNGVASLNSSDEALFENFETEVNKLTTKNRNPGRIKKGVSKRRDVPTGKTCSIYLPQSVQITDGVQIENLDLGVVGAGVERLVGSGTGPIDALINETGNAIASVADFLMANATQDTARATMARLAGMIPGEKYTGAIRSALATTPAPNTRALFKAVNLREFAFSFNFIPKTQKESEEIKKIIKFFRSELYPESIRSEGSIPLGYKFPNKFKISIEYDDKPIATGILKSYLRNFQATYNPNSMAMFETGDFQEISITMSFVEDRTLDKDDILSGRY